MKTNWPAQVLKPPACRVYAWKKKLAPAAATVNGTLLLAAD